MFAWDFAADVHSGGRESVLQAVRWLSHAVRRPDAGHEERYPLQFVFAKTGGRRSEGRARFALEPLPRAVEVTAVARCRTPRGWMGMMRNTAFRAQSRMRGLIVAPLLAGVACFALPAWAGSAAQPAGSELVSAGVNGVSTGGASSGVALDGDGSVIAFHSDASQLVSGDTNQVRDVFVYDSTTDEVERISVASDGRAANRASHAAGGAPSLSADGELVAFYSDATNLVDADVAGERDVYEHDRELGATELITARVGGRTAIGPS